MNLTEFVNLALQATIELRHELTSHPTDDHSELLSARGAALQSFETAHRQATNAERVAVSEELQQLHAADLGLREFCQNEKEALAAQANQIGQRLTTPQQQQKSGPSDIPLIDRKA